MNFLVTAAAAAASSVALPRASQGGPALVDLANSDCIEGTPVAAKPAARGLAKEPFPEYPPEIFGKLPDGFVFEEQQIEMLCFWHRKAIEVIDQQILTGEAITDVAADEKLTAYCETKNRILAAILSARAARSGRRRCRAAWYRLGMMYPVVSGYAGCQPCDLKYGFHATL